MMHTVIVCETIFLFLFFQNLKTIFLFNFLFSSHNSVHFYNYLSDAWDSNIYPKPRFVSEYGFQSIPSMHSIKSTMNPTDQLNEIIEHRQHFPLGSVPIINLIKRHLPLPEENSTNYWKAFIYFSQLSQAIATKTETETYRFNV